MVCELVEIYLLRGSYEIQWGDNEFNESVGRGEQKWYENAV